MKTPRQSLLITRREIKVGKGKIKVRFKNLVAAAEFMMVYNYNASVLMQF